jgi:hypothetical protein
VKAILLVVIVVGVCAAALMYPIFPRLNPNAGFGPDWDCTMQAKGDPCLHQEAKLTLTIGRPNDRAGTPSMK